MANKLKATVHLNDNGNNDPDVRLDLTADQAVRILDAVFAGETLEIVLMTPPYEVRRENPAGYAA